MGSIATALVSPLVKNASKCQKTLFKVANELLDKNNERVFPQHTDSKQLANDFNHFYVDKIQKIRKKNTTSYT
jgi:hypothetical protein